jgi:hypothetical protein
MTRWYTGDTTKLGTIDESIPNFHKAPQMNSQRSTKWVTEDKKWMS